MRHERVRKARRLSAGGKTPALTRLQRVVGRLQRHFRWVEAAVPQEMELKVHIAQDAESGIWFIAESDIPGLRLEADSADELIRKIEDVAPDLVELNCDEILGNLDAEPEAEEPRCRPVIRPIFDTPMALAG